MKNQRFLLYVISGLTVATVISVLLSNLFPTVFAIGNKDFSKWGLAAVLAEIIGLFVLIAKTAFKTKHLNIYLAIPDNLQHLANKIIWKKDKCFMLLGELKEKITLLRSDVGPGFKVQFDQDISNRIIESEVIEFELMENTGKKWRVGPFRLYDSTRTLECLETNLTSEDYD